MKRFFFCCCTALLGLTSLVQAQPQATPQAVPLFADDAVLSFTLEADFAQLLRDREEENPERPGFLRLIEGRDTLTLDVDVRTRGNFRLKRSTCAFPPLRLDLKKSQLDDTVFDGQDKLKLVTHCNTRRGELFQQYVIKEYLAYRTFNLLTDLSFRVRMARITYLDTAGEEKPVTRYGFLIEDKDNLAERLDGTIRDLERIPQRATQGDHMLLTAVFQYMIGNTDWAVSALHNIELLFIDLPNVPYAIPYDFDWSGLVDARYARPGPEHSELRSVRQRKYLGLCRPLEAYTPIVERFQAQEAEIRDLFATYPLLSDKTRKDVLRYLDEFFDVLNDPDAVEQAFVYTCRDYD